MPYARVIDGAIVGDGDPPRRFFDGTQWQDWRDAAIRVPETFAPWFLPIVETPRPADTATTTSDGDLAMVDGKPTQVWVVRDKTEDEIARDADATAESNATTLQGLARAALVGNKAFLNLASPTNAQTLAQVRALTRQNNALIRLATRSLSEIEGA